MNTNYPYIHPNDIPEEHILDCQREFEKGGRAKPSAAVLAVILADAQNRIIQKINDESGLRK